MGPTPTDVREAAVLRAVEIRATDDGRRRFTAAFDAMSPERSAIVAAVGELWRRLGRPA